jgi:phosphoribosylformylglycinamidine synthase
MSAIRRVFVEKKSEYAIEAERLLRDLVGVLGVPQMQRVRILVRYDVEGMSDADYSAALWTIFAEPPLDVVYEENFDLLPNEVALAVEYLPGQYDQRADSAAQCIRLLRSGDGSAEAIVACSKVYVFEGALAAGQVEKIKKYLINPVDSREAALAKPFTLDPALPEPEAVKALEGFLDADEAGLQALLSTNGMAMTLADLCHTQAYFRDTEGRCPTETELRLLDTYWSDHCRHTTFLTELTDIGIEDGPLAAPIQRSLEQYRSVRGQVFQAFQVSQAFRGRGAERPECLMDMALLPARHFKSIGRLGDVEESSEINACSLVIDVDNTAAPSGSEPMLLMFKNETHNHPTEIEPFGGAATCLGGAIRDPLSGRAYVYQSMRVTGSGDPRPPVENALAGKLPQRKITQEAARGFSSYGNQIGLCTGQVTEIYDEGYVAKRMEIGAVLGAVPRAQVRREEPVPGDIVALIGGPTGRDGIGGATGSSKSHTEASIEQCGAEVQKGDPPMERRLQRLFRREGFARLIKKCNDFGAGGIAVAIGELADGLRIDLDAIPKKYEGLNGTELAISESQERMAVVVAPGDFAELGRQADMENLEAIKVAEVTEAKRLVMVWRGKTIVDVSRAFLDTNGARSFAKAFLCAPDPGGSPLCAPGGSQLCAPGGSQLGPKHIADAADVASAWMSRLADLNTCSQRGLVELFDSTIGAASVLVPFGGRRRRTPTESMVAKIPVHGGETLTASAMSHAFFPSLSRWSPFHGAIWAHVAAAAKLVAAGASLDRLRFTLQEYFCKPRDDPRRWGQPVAALLGALHAQLAIGAPAIGGKDSMSGTFKELDVPPTLVAFAVATLRVDEIVTPELKEAGSHLALVELPITEEHLPSWPAMHAIYPRIAQLVRNQRVRAIYTVGMDGLAAALSKMAFGNAIGIDLSSLSSLSSMSGMSDLGAEYWLRPRPGSFVLEIEPGADIGLASTHLGRTIAEPIFRVGGREISLFEAERAWEGTLEAIFPTNFPAKSDKEPPALPPFKACTPPPSAKGAPSIKAPAPRALLTVFPGTNCEYDTEAAFKAAGAAVETLVFRNMTPRAISESLEALAQAISRANIVAIPGGFSAGDEPEGSGKFIAAAYRAPRVRDAVHELLQRDGLMLGICNGFQALIKLGLVPFGEIREQDGIGPTLTFNSLRYTSRMAFTRIVSNVGPWLSRVSPGDTHLVAVAHGEGRVIGDAAMLRGLLECGQVATQYVDGVGRPSMDLEYNPNGSALAIEGLLSPDGRVFGKMAHAERHAPHVWRNALGEKDMGIFRAGVEYFK